MTGVPDELPDPASPPDVVIWGLLTGGVYTVGGVYPPPPVLVPPIFPRLPNNPVRACVDGDDS